MDSTPIENFMDKVQKLTDSDYQTAYIAPDAKVLVVDDNESNLKVFSNLLKETKVQITEAYSGFECLELVKETRFDIIFMDHMMPKMDGVQTLEVFKKMEDNLSKDTSVIILTANAVVGAKEYYLSMGFDAFLSKPIEPSKLEDILFKTLDKDLLQPYEKKEIKCTVKIDVMELQEYYENIADREMQKQYQIKVHSMKNSAAMIGIIQLTGLAMELEQAARDGEITIIQSLHTIFTTKYLSYQEKLKLVLPQQMAKKVASEHTEETNDIYNTIRKAASDMDVDTLDEMSAKLDEYVFEEEQNTNIEKIKLYILNLEVDKLQKI